MKKDWLEQPSRSAVYGAAAVLLRQAGAQDAEGIARLYRAVQIVPTDGDGLSILGFARQGGMFEIPTLQKISQECADKYSAFSVAVCRQEVTALMRIDEDLSAYHMLAPHPSSTLHYVELAVRSSLPRLAEPFLLANFTALRQAGCERLLFEIYHLLSLRRAGEKTALELDNLPSVRLHLGLGARKIGELEPKTIPFGDRALDIRPDVYELLLEQASQKLMEQSMKRGWKIYDEENDG